MVDEDYSQAGEKGEPVSPQPSAVSHQPSRDFGMKDRRRSFLTTDQ
jgi:hypothetical protein